MRQLAEACVCVREGVYERERASEMLGERKCLRVCMYVHTLLVLTMPSTKQQKALESEMHIVLQCKLRV